MKSIKYLIKYVPTIQCKSIHTLHNAFINLASVVRSINPVMMLAMKIFLISIFITLTRFFNTSKQYVSNSVTPDHETDEYYNGIL